MERGRPLKVKRFGDGKDGHNTWRVKPLTLVPAPVSIRDIRQAKNALAGDKKLGSRKKANYVEQMCRSSGAGLGSFMITVASKMRRGPSQAAN
jgi:hypothetical protein